MIVPKFEVGDIVVTNLWEYGVVEKIEEHILISTYEVVHVYYLRMFENTSISTVVFNEEVLTKISK